VRVPGTRGQEHLQYLRRNSRNFDDLLAAQETVEQLQSALLRVEFPSQGTLVSEKYSDPLCQWTLKIDPRALYSTSSPSPRATCHRTQYMQAIVAK
jgi:hypothetical protein